MDSSVGSKQFPLWCATATDRRYASIVMAGLWVVGLGMIASAVVCPYPMTVRLIEAALGMYLAVRLAPMTRLLLRSMRSNSQDERIHQETAS
jgi:hypothetical protein